jgi:hypothetical protein
MSQVFGSRQEKDLTERASATQFEAEDYSIVKSQSTKGGFQMKFVSPVILVTAIALSLAGSVAAAQCTPGFTQYEAYCANSQGQQDGITYTLPSDPGVYGVPFFCGTIYCLSTAFPNCYAGIGDCYFARLTDPGVRQRLIELAKSEDLMVATCGGKYSPLLVALGEDARPVLRPRRTLVPLRGVGE